MTKDEIKNLLCSYKDLRKERDQLRKMVAQFESTMYSPSGPNLDGMPRNPSTGNPVLNATAQHLALLDRYRTALDRVTAAQTRIEQMIEGLDSKYRVLLRCRYIDGMTWEKVCVAVNYSWRRTHYLHSQALNLLAEKYKEK